MSIVPRQNVQKIEMQKNHLGICIDPLYLLPFGIIWRIPIDGSTQCMGSSFRNYRRYLPRRYLPYPLESLEVDLKMT